MQSVVMALESFSGVRADRLIFTKLDEAAAVGVILEVAGRVNLPLSYLTHGQDVPNDIEVATATRLALMMTEPSGRQSTGRK
jgi:flagellar biosynthesis protein FlhF